MGNVQYLILRERHVLDNVQGIHFECVKLSALKIGFISHLFGHLAKSPISHINHNIIYKKFNTKIIIFSF